MQPDSEESNEMVFCDQCNICVHQVWPLSKYQAMAPSLTCPLSGVLRHHQHPQRALALQDVHPRDQAPLRTLSQQGKNICLPLKNMYKKHILSGKYLLFLKNIFGIFHAHSVCRVAPWRARAPGTSGLTCPAHFGYPRCPSETSRRWNPSQKYLVFRWVKTHKNISKLSKISTTKS